MITPAWLVALSSLLAAILFLTNKREIHIDVKIFAIPFIMQFVIYSIFVFSDSPNFPDPQKQFIARSSVVFTSFAMSIVLIITRWRYGK